MTRFVRLSAGRLVGWSALRRRRSVCHNLHFLVPIGTLFSFIHYFTKAKLGDRQKQNRKEMMIYMDILPQNTIGLLIFSNFQSQSRCKYLMETP